MDLRVLFIPTSNAGVTYYRMKAFADAAHRNRTFNAHLLWWKKDLTDSHPWEFDILDAKFYARIMNELNACVRMADVVVMGMVHTPAALDLFLTIKEAYPHIPLVAEIDDNMLSTPTYNPASGPYAPNSEPRNIAVMQFRSADAMIVTTPGLEDVYQDLCPHINIVQNSIDFSRWDNLKKGQKPGLRIGWAGGASHDDDLALLKGVIPQITSKFSDLKFVFVHGAPKSIRGLPGVEAVTDWAYIDKYPAHLAKQDFDIGLAPLVDNAFNRGKSNLRWLEYSALGIPTVASRVGHFEQTIRDGKDGLLVDNDWVTPLTKLITDKCYRKRIGASANLRVRQDFNVDKETIWYRDVLETIATRGQIRKVFTRPAVIRPGAAFDEAAPIFEGHA